MVSQKSEAPSFYSYNLSEIKLKYSILRDLKKLLRHPPFLFNMIVRALYEQHDQKGRSSF